MISGLVRVRLNRASSGRGVCTTYSMKGTAFLLSAQLAERRARVKCIPCIPFPVDDETNYECGCMRQRRSRSREELMIGAREGFIFNGIWRGNDGDVTSVISVVMIKLSGRLVQYLKNGDRVIMIVWTFLKRMLFELWVKKWYVCIHIPRRFCCKKLRHQTLRLVFNRYRVVKRKVTKI